MSENEKPGVNLDIQDAKEGFERFRREFEQDKAFYKSLATKKQKPRLLWIGCCDSRVVPAQITSADPGELFEVRNIANTVPPYGADDDSVGAAIEYALGSSRHRRHRRVRTYRLRRHSGPCRAHPSRYGGSPRPLGGVHAQGARSRSRGARAGRTTLDRDHQGAHTFPARQPDDLPGVSAGVAAGKVSVHGWLYDME